MSNHNQLLIFVYLCTIDVYCQQVYSSLKERLTSIFWIGKTIQKESR